MPSVDHGESNEPIRFGPHSVPRIWQHLLPEDAFYFRPDAEAASSCFACPMVEEARFHPDVRCCTVIPKVPNFLLGLALMEGNPFVEEVLRRGLLLPEGLIISPADLATSLRFIQQPNEGLPAVVCPFLDRTSRRCGIYAFRNATCSSFFCKHDRGEAGALFWSDLADLVTQLETTLAQWAIEAVGLDLDQLFADLDTADFGLGPWPEELRNKLFGVWAGRERAFFIACAERVLAAKDELFAIASRFQPRQTKAYDETLRRRLTPEIPRTLLEEALPVGEPQSIDALWYALKLSARNLQLSAKT